MKDEATDAALALAIAGDDAVDRLIDMMAVSSRFHFFIVACDTPRTATVALASMHRRIEAERGESAILERLDPYANTDVVLDEPLAPEVLVGGVLPCLLGPQGGGAPGTSILVLDASRAVQQDELAWIILFQRMNEQRNAITRAVTGSLVLCIPIRLEAVFARFAPDFWSIRSSAVSLNVELPRAPRIAFLQELLRQDLPWNVWWVWLMTPSRVPSEEEVASDAGALVDWVQRCLTLGDLDEAGRVVQRSFDAVNRDPVEHAELHRLRGRYAWIHAWTLCFSGRVEQARALYERVVLKETRREAAKMGDVHARIVLSDELAELGTLRRWGAPRSAVEALESSVEIVRSLLTESHGQLQGGRDVSFADKLERLGDARFECGELGQADALYRECLDELKRSGTPQVGTQLRRGLVEWARGRLEAAVELCRAAVESVREAARTDLEFGPWSHHLALHLGNLGELHEARGDAGRASAALAEAERICRQFHEQWPKSIFWRDTLAASLMRRARLREGVGEASLEDLTSMWWEAHSLYVGLLEVAAQREDWRREASACAREIARIQATGAAGSG